MLQIRKDIIKMCPLLVVIIFSFLKLLMKSAVKKEDINAGYVKDSIKNGFVIFLNTLKCVPPLMALHVFGWNY